MLLNLGCSLSPLQRPALPVRLLTHCFNHKTRVIPECLRVCVGYMS